MTYAEITGWGKALPPVVLTNSDLERIVDTSDDWITTRTGIKERRITHVELSELSALAMDRALAAAGREIGELDVLITATCTPETLIPPTSALVQSRLGSIGGGAFDLNANCSGFLYSLVVATSMIRSGAAARIGIVGAEKLSYVVDYTERTTCVLFGDGAGAAVLEATDEPLGLLASNLGVDGDASKFLKVPRFGTAGMRGRIDPKEASVFMDGQEVFRRAVTKMAESAVAVVEEAGWSFDDIDMLIPHQANLRIIDATARRLKLDESKVFVNVHAYGNTSAATIPVALAEALDSGRLDPGARIVMAAFGGGLTWAAGAVRWGQRTEPIGYSDRSLPETDETVWTLLGPALEHLGHPGVSE
jgi:3-oxoacyl-[acyl-carrier-protein] synthase-3